MKLFRGKIPIIAAEITRMLVEEGDIECESNEEVELDVEAVLREYLRTEQDIVEKAKDMLEKRGLSYSSFGKTRKIIADQKGFGTGEEAYDYIMNQLILTFMNSPHVEEIYSEDHELKRKMRTVMRKHMEIDDELDEEARRKIKNLEEGTQQWEIEYKKVMEQVKRKRGLE